MNNYLNIDKQKIKIAILLIFVGVLGRIAFHDFFNNIKLPFTEYGFLDVFFIIALVSIFAGILLGKYFVFIIPLCVISITDIYFGIINPVNTALWSTWLFLFTTSGYVFIALFGMLSKRNSKFEVNYIPKFLGIGFIGIIIYDLWTNFGFWLSYSKLGFYPQTLSGLLSVYFSGIAFMLWHLLSFSIVFSLTLIPIIIYKKNTNILTVPLLKPTEKIYILCTTLILVVASIISTLI